MKTRTEELHELLLLQAQQVADKKLHPKKRHHALVRLSQTMFELTRPSFDGSRLAKAMRLACVIEPDFGSSAVYEESTGQLHVFGGFDLGRLSQLYFVGEAKVVEGKK